MKQGNDNFKDINLVEKDSCSSALNIGVFHERIHSAFS
jgi:hypothetical protein